MRPQRRWPFKLNARTRVVLREDGRTPELSSRYSCWLPACVALMARAAAAGALTANKLLPGDREKSSDRGSRAGISLGAVRRSGPLPDRRALKWKVAVSYEDM